MPAEPVEEVGREAQASSPAPRRRAARVGLFAGPLLAVSAHLALPDAYAGAGGELVPFGAAGRATAALAIWMGVWWLTEAVAVYVTALLPLVALPLLGAASMRDAAAPYAHPLIFLFMGGFLIALAMQRWGLHRRLALSALRLAGDQPTHIVAAFMGVTAFLSMWVSNTATSIMLLPVALSVIDRVAGPAREGEGAEATALEGPVHTFAVALLLGIAYSASIGGMATPIGTPPNVLLLSYMEDHLDRSISFVRWMAMALPLVAIFLPLTWLLLTRVLSPVKLGPIPGGRSVIRDALRALGPMRPPERIVLAVFVLASGLWLTRPLLTALELGGTRPLAGLSDAGVAMLAALLLFVAPAGRRGAGFVLDWDTAVKLPWGILILFGGGLSLAAAIRTNGVDQLLGAQVSGLAGVPPLVVMLAVVTLIVFLTELTSNTATTAALVPVLAALAPALGLDPVLLVVPAALSASCAFMLPVATPPNAVVFGSRLVSALEMIRAGFWLNWVGIALIALFFYAVGSAILLGG